MMSRQVGAAIFFTLWFAWPLGAYCYDCRFVFEKATRVTFATGKSQTARDNARCICTDAEGTAHMVWEDMRNANFEIYYASSIGDSITSQLRITHSRAESSYPCVACDSENVYILWQEFVERDSEIFYVRLKDGQEVARKRITRTNLNSACPVSVVGPDNSLHIAWHEGPYQRTAVFYGKIVGDSLVESREICVQHPEAFRPDIACDTEGRVLLAWFEGFQVKSRFWDGTSWGEEMLVATNKSKPWRLSLASLSGGKWALAWFDGDAEGYDILVKFYDGKDWYGQSRINPGRMGYYPSLTRLSGGGLAVVWEGRVADSEDYMITLRCYDGTEWSRPIELYRERVAGRYASLASHEDYLHCIWFSGKGGDNEIYHGLLRSE